MNAWGEKRLPFLFVIDYKMEDIFLCPLDQLIPNEIQFSTPFFNSMSDPLPHLDHGFSFTASPPSFEAYNRAYAHVLNEINYGNSYLTNLTFPSGIKTNLSLKDIFLYSDAPYKLLFKNKFVVFSPEIFVQVRDGKIYSHPMKGTINGELPGAMETILGNSKELAEHATIVDLIRNDMSITAKNVKVEKFRYIDKILTHSGKLLQVSSCISGDLPPNYNQKIGDILFSLLPAGSITGAPKEKTLEIIEEAENYKRGYYTGVFGIFDGQILDSGVMIRFIEKSKDGYIFKSGGGINAYSNPREEYQELINKIYVPISRNIEGSREKAFSC
jgi:para-aminobenzoate synthetase component 1